MVREDGLKIVIGAHLSDRVSLDIGIQLFKQATGPLSSKLPHILIFQKEVDSQVSFRNYSRIQNGELSNA